MNSCTFSAIRFSLDLLELKGRPKFTQLMIDGASNHRRETHIDAVGNVLEGILYLCVILRAS
jgi:hypothetical protein